jgi:two-component system, NtrC family, nitrogen regulation sensor histidine kinase GlnL
MANIHFNASVIDFLQAAMMCVGHDGVVLEANHAAQNLWIAQRLVGSSIASLSQELADAVMRTLQQSQDQVLRDLVLKMADGRREMTDAHLQMVDGATTPTILVELHRRPATWLEVSSARQVDAFTRALAHELHNPLAGLRGAAQLLSQCEIDPDRRELIDVIIEESRRIEALSRALLGDSKAPRLLPINAHEVLDKALLSARIESANKCQFVADYDPSLPAILADADALTQLVLNLLKNAIQAGAAVVRLRTRLERSVMLAEKLNKIAFKLEVIDDGCGVPNDRLEAIFLPLVSGRDGGHGFGLAIARSIAFQHGGSLNGRSIPGETTFSLLLPFSAADTLST